MTEPSLPEPDADASVPAGDQAALSEALQQVLAPLARLAVAQGLPYAVVDEMLRRSVVREAHAAHPDLPEHRRVSRVSTSTGLNRREVGRLLAAAPERLAPARSPLNEVFAHWLIHPAYRDADGHPLPLPRTGPAPSFEALAHEISRDVHPRSFLEELLRLGLAEHDDTSDTVHLSRKGFVPREDLRQMVGFLGANVGDHLAAAVANVLDTGGGRKPHFEQAVFGEGLSAASVAELREVLRGHWKTLAADLVHAHRGAGRARRRRAARAPPSGCASACSASTRRRRRRRAARPLNERARRRLHVPTRQRAGSVPPKENPHGPLPPADD